jgi:hypothetical protein
MLSPEDRQRRALAPLRALAQNGPSCTLTNSTIQEGSRDHNSELHQSPRPPRPSPARGPTPSSPRQGPTRGGDPPRRLSFHAAAHPGDLTRRRSDGCRPFPAPIHLARPAGRRSCSDRRRSCQGSADVVATQTAVGNRSKGQCATSESVVVRLLLGRELQLADSFPRIRQFAPARVTARSGLEDRRCPVRETGRVCHLPVCPPLEAFPLGFGRQWGRAI